MRLVTIPRSYKNLAKFIFFARDFAGSGKSSVSDL